MPLLRVRTKDGTERLTVEGSATLAAVKAAIEATLGVPIAQQVLSRAEQSGPVARKGAAFGSADEAQLLSALGIAGVSL